VPDVTDPSGRWSRRSALGRRLLPPLLATAVFGAMWLLFLLGYRDLYYAIYLWWGFFPFPDPFMDTAAVLMAIDCHRAGIDIWHANPCMNGGWYTYSPFLLRAASLPLTHDTTLPIGVGFVVLFLLSQLVLPASRDWKEVGIRSVALLSAATAFAVERANLDIAIYALAVGGVWLLQRTSLRWVGYGTFVLAALAKFYPATLLILAARERTRTAMIVGAIGTMILVLPVILFAGEMRTALNVTPVGWPFSNMFGALNIPYGIFVIPALTVTDNLDTQVLRTSLPWQAKALLAALVALTGYIAGRHLGRDRAALPALSGTHVAYLVAGAVIVTGCFFAAQNIAYRAIFLLMTLPGLYLLMASDRSGPVRYRSLIVAVLFVMWQELPRRLLERLAEDGSFGFGPYMVFWAIRELIWWWLVARLISLLAAFLLDSPALEPLGRLVDRHVPRLRKPDGAGGSATP
jgi:hypothetical protein